LMSAYYNEFDPYAAQWLRNLIAAGHIAPGDVDERSIIEVQPDDLRHYTQCHFFAGIGGWSHALRLAGWPDDKPVWTGSCPCQPFSQAGKGNGMSDERHLWPSWFHLISQCQPSIIFGEQVDAAIRHGWLDLVSTDLEAIGYAFGATGLPAASVGAPHIRQRLWFVGESDRDGSFPRCGTPTSAGQRCTTVSTGGNVGVPVGDANNEGLQRWGGTVGNSVGTLGYLAARSATRPWDELEWIACSDGKTRPTQSGIFPLANGISGRVGRLRAYGNAIVPQVAAEWIKIVMSYRP
jgi:DNA (cytosine-5)-methyltransferase 1